MFAAVDVHYPPSGGAQAWAAADLSAAAQELLDLAGLLQRGWEIETAMGEAAARRWVDEVDEANARAIAARRGLADLWIYMSTPEAEVPPPTPRNLAVSATSTAPSSVKATQ